MGAEPIQAPEASHSGTGVPEALQGLWAFELRVGDLWRGALPPQTDSVWPSWEQDFWTVGLACSQQVSAVAWARGGHVFSG